jgi:hypothetical protein
VKRSETLNDFLHDLDSAEGWAESDRHDREVAADFEAFTLSSRVLITSILRKYRNSNRSRSRKMRRNSSLADWANYKQNG